MPGNVDSLQIKINADASKAIQAIDQVTKHLTELARVSGRSAGGMKAINQSLKDLGASVKDTKKIGNPFTEMTKGMKNYQNALKGISGSGVTINAQSVYFRDLANATGQAGDSASNASNKVRKFGSSLGFLKTSAKIARIALLPLTGAFKLVGNAAQGGIKKLTGFLKSIVRIAMYRAIRSALKAITQALSQGTENLYYFSQAVGSNFAPSMDRLATSMLYLKNGFASMFSPLVEYFTPLIETLVDKLVDAFNWVQRLFAQLTGKTQWNKAVKVQTVYKEATDNTTKAVKKLRQEIQLMDFDELNNITENKDDGSGSSTPETKNPDPVKMFELQPTGVDPYDEGSFFANLKKWWEDVDPIGWLWDKVSTWWRGIDFKNVGEKVGEVIRNVIESIDWKGLWQAMKEIFGDLKDFLEGVARGLFPDYFAKKDAEKAEKERVAQLVKEAEKESEEYYAERKFLESQYDSAPDPGSWYPIAALEYPDKDVTIQMLQGEIIEIEKDITSVERRNNSINDSIKKLFTDANGVYNEDERKSYDTILKHGTYQEIAGQMAIDKKFAAYVSLKGELEDNEKLIKRLMEARKQYDKISTAVSKNELESIESVKKALKAYGKDAEGVFDHISETLPGSAALVAARAVASFKEADWANGGSSAMKKLDKALREARIPEDVRKLALQSAANFAAEKGWVTNGAKAADLIGNSLHNADIPGEYQKVAKNALQGYLTYVDWENGGKATAGGIVNAFLAAGIPSEYAYVAGQSVYEFLNSVQWEVTGSTAGGELANGAVAGYNKGINESTLAPLKVRAEVATTPGTIAYEQNKVTATLYKNNLLDPIGLKTKLPLSTQADILGMTNNYVDKVNTSAKMLAVKPKVFINSTPKELTDSMNRRIDSMHPKDIPVQAQITTTTADLQKQINNVFANVTPPTLKVNYRPADLNSPIGNFLLKADRDMGLYGRFASGGFPAQGTMFVAGEMAGQAEMVGNINGRTGVASGQEITGIGDAVWSTGGTTARLIGELIEVVRSKNLTISPSASLGRTVAKSQRMYAAQTG